MINGKKLIALCTSRVYEPQTHGYIVRLNELLKNEGFALLIFTLNSDIYWEEDRQATEKYVFDLIPYRYIDAVIIMDEKIKSHKVSNKIISKAAENSVPVIVVDGTYENTVNVSFDYDQGFESVVRHAIEHHGVKKPHFMAGIRNNKFSDARIDIFKKVLVNVAQYFPLIAVIPAIGFEPKSIIGVQHFKDFQYSKQNFKPPLIIISTFIKHFIKNVP